MSQVWTFLKMDLVAVPAGRNWTAAAFGVLHIFSLQLEVVHQNHLCTSCYLTSSPLLCTGTIHVQVAIWHHLPCCALEPSMYKLLFQRHHLSMWHIISSPTIVSFVHWNYPCISHPFRPWIYSLIMPLNRTNAEKREAVKESKHRSYRKLVETWVILQSPLPVYISQY